MKILEFYESFLKSLGMTSLNGSLTHEDGSPVTFKYNDVSRPMVLPIYRLIKDGLVDEYGKELHAFHPLCESVLDGESATIRFIKRAICNRIYVLGLDLITKILLSQVEGKIPVSAVMKKFLASQTEGAKDVKFDKVLLKSWSSVINYIDDIESKKRIMLYISANQTIDKIKYIRVARYKTIFEEEGDDNTATYLGAKLQRKSDKFIINNLLKTVFGWYPSEVGSNDQRAYFGCLSRGWAEFVINYNKIVKAMKDICVLPVLDDAWIPEIETMRDFDGVIQTLPYNTGVKKTDTGESVEYKLTSNNTTNVIAPKASDLVSEDSGSDPLAIFSRKNGNGSLNNNLSYSDLLLAKKREEEFARLPPIEQEILLGKKAYHPPSITSMSLSEALTGKKSAVELELERQRELALVKLQEQKLQILNAVQQGLIHPNDPRVLAVLNPTVASASPFSSPFDSPFNTQAPQQNNNGTLVIGGASAPQNNTGTFVIGGNSGNNGGRSW